jgi:hypothetical protein
MKHFYSLSDCYREKYGCKIYKLSISGGMTCPNRDGTLGTRGCIFCSAGGSGDFAAPASMNIADQLETAKQRVKSKNKGGKYIAYFQPFTNTYAPPEKLRQLYHEAIAPDAIVALSIATRPDCLDEEVLAVLDEVNRMKPVTVELGLQTIHEDTAVYIRRGYPLSVYDRAMDDLHAIGIEVVTHVILGLPGEDADRILDTVRYVGRVTDGIKLQLLHVIEGTDLADDYRAGRFETLSLEAYTDILCRAIELLPPHVVIHRITGDGAKRSLVAPLWSADKKRVLNYINKVMDDRNIIQGKSITT